MKALIESLSSSFNYCPLIWMLYSRTMNNRTNRIHKRALRLVYSDNFEKLLKKDGSFSIHDRNIQTLAIEIYLDGLSPSIIKNIFQVNTNNQYNLRSRNELYCRNPKTVKYGTEAISCLVPKVWSLIPEIIKSSKTDIFKKKIRKWKPDCPCRLCKTYLQYVGFIYTVPCLEPVEYIG